MSWSPFDRPTDGEAVLFLPGPVIDARSGGHLRCDRLVDIASWIPPNFQIPARRQDRPRSSGVVASQLLMAGRYRGTLQLLSSRVLAGRLDADRHGPDPGLADRSLAGVATSRRPDPDVLQTPAI
jgi:hypothetical protein